METLDKHFRAISKAAFSRYGHAYGEILTHWREIAGESVAAWCEPDKLSWPKTATEDAQKSGGTLVLRVAPGRALDIQYETPHLIDRVNRFFGYGAIAAIKIRQTQLSRAKSRKPDTPDASPSVELTAKLAAVADDKLKQALARLGHGALAVKSGSPQVK
ncbi:MAG: DUF721 domain-containing protein [Rhizobiales bacterium]|nr:DUF721 domain-containing protein [Hyphomicrobiales bacterium]